MGQTPLCKTTGLGREKLLNLKPRYQYQRRIGFDEYVPHEVCNAFYKFLRVQDK
jgi:hypothetical protein